MALKPSLRDVMNRLRLDGVLPAGAYERALPAFKAWWKKHGATPWYVRVLIGGGAWVASIFLLLFFGMLLSFMGLKGEGALILVGLLVTGGAVFLRHQSEHDFLTQLSLAFGLAGQGLIVGGVGEVAESVNAAAAAMLVVQCVLLFIYPDRIQRFLSTVGACAAGLYLLHEAGGWWLVDVELIVIAAGAHLVFLHQARLLSGRFGALVGPLGYGLVSVLFGTLLVRTLVGAFQHALNDSGAIGPTYGLLSPGLAAVAMYTAYRALEENGLEASGPAGVTVFVSLGLTALLTLNTPGVIAALGILALAFHRRAVVLLGLAVAFLLAFGVYYYYDLTLSLLAKSLVLMGSGLLLFGLRFFVLRHFPAAPAPSARRTR